MSSHPQRRGLFDTVPNSWPLSRIFCPTLPVCSVGNGPLPTRVGNGPFPTEQTGSVGQKIRESGHEFGTVSKRPRRCGWLDIPQLRYAIRLNGCTSLAITKID